MVQALSVKSRSKISWKAIGLALNALVVSIALFILYRTLRNVDLHKVWATMADTSAWSVALAGLFVAGGYMTMTLYDYFALRTIGRDDVPYRTAALAGFTSYAIGHNVGAAALVAGAVRLHVYSAWGLSLVEVAKIAFITGLTFWLGNTFALGLALTFAPDLSAAVTRLQPAINQLLGAVALTIIIAYMMWLLPAPRSLRHREWRLGLPGARMTLVQIGIGCLDLAAGALAFYVLLPDEPGIGFAVVAVAFLVATLLGFISHAPGSLGVFDTAMIVALSRYPTEHLVATLLIFRCLYFVLPLVVAVAILAAREVRVMQCG
ncbi:MAG: UPF0104 family protein [Sphingomonadales bacterium]|nr:UPF0104 family protein [Sphingomonadales bacterium]